MKNKLFLTLALLAGFSYITAQYNDDPTRDDQWGLDMQPGDNPYVDEWGYDMHPGNRRMQTKRNVVEADDSDSIDNMTDDVDVPGIDDQWGPDQ
jgi:hypothetical protein